MRDARVALLKLHDKLLEMTFKQQDGIEVVVTQHSEYT
jgi:hypothetical protein